MAVVVWMPFLLIHRAPRVEIPPALLLSLLLIWAGVAAIAVHLYRPEVLPWGARLGSILAIIGGLLGWRSDRRDERRLRT